MCDNDLGGEGGAWLGIPYIRLDPLLSRVSRTHATPVLFVPVSLASLVSTDE